MSKRKTEGFDLSILARDSTPSNWGHAALSIHRVIGDEYYSSKGYSSPSVSLIANLTSASRATIFRTISALQELGLWTVEPGNGTRRSRYIPNIPELERLQAEKRAAWCEASKAKKTAVGAAPEHTDETEPMKEAFENAVSPDWLAKEEHQEEETVLSEEVSTPAPVEAPVSAPIAAQPQSPAQPVQTPSTPQERPEKVTPEPIKPYSSTTPMVTRIIDELGKPSRTPAERALAAKFVPFKEKPTERFLVGLRVALQGAGGNGVGEQALIAHLSRLINALPPEKHPQTSLPGWLEVFGGDDVEAHERRKAAAPAVLSHNLWEAKSTATPADYTAAF